MTLASTAPTSLASLITEVAGLIVILGGLCAAIVFLGRMSRQWQRMETTLETLVARVRDIVIDKEKDHAELRAATHLVDQRLRDHEQYHMLQRNNTGKD